MVLTILIEKGGIFTVNLTMELFSKNNSPVTIHTPNSMKINFFTMRSDHPAKKIATLKISNEDQPQSYKTPSPISPPIPVIIRSEPKPSKNYTPIVNQDFQITAFNSMKNTPRIPAIPTIINQPKPIGGDSEKPIMIPGELLIAFEMLTAKIRSNVHHQFLKKKLLDEIALAKVQLLAWQIEKTIAMINLMMHEISLVLSKQRIALRLVQQGVLVLERSLIAYLPNVSES